VRSLCLLLLVACGKDAPTTRPAAVTDKQVATADRLLAIFVDLGAKLDHATDCKEATASLVAARVEFEKMAADAGELADQALAAPAIGAWMQSYTVKLAEAMKGPLQTRTIACHEDEAYMDAVKHLPMVRKKS